MRQFFFVAALPNGPVACDRLATAIDYAYF
jgi:hypothetical protein